ncbi:PREDICTED: NXPE family member 1-like [Branchiostoma belcheri]|uniref:NXPE family member 1-like n=1 Tax=Branchiostoma belcheri TaxID=7741 RepID=A0A6P4YRY2_BRABE|nr:PREDICTED: NXPE family member 1-like [Branchiostoma belcheri]
MARARMWVPFTVLIAAVMIFLTTSEFQFLHWPNAEMPLASPNKATVMSPNKATVRVTSPNNATVRVTSPNYATVTSPNDATVTSPNNATVTSPNDATVTSPKNATVTSPNNAIMTSPNDASVTSPNKPTVCVTSPNNATVTSPNNATVTSPNNATVTSQNKPTLTSPNHATVTSPNDATVTSPNDATVMSPNNATVTYPNDATVTSQNKPTLTSPNDATVTSPNNATMTSPNDATVTSPNKPTVCVTSPNNATVTSPNNATVTSPNDATVTSLNNATVTSPNNATVTSPSDATVTSPNDATATITCPNKTNAVVLNRDQGFYHLGDVLTVRVVARDQEGRPKTYGGDFFRARLVSSDRSILASSAGHVTDHRNGTYTVQLPLYWAGNVSIKIQLVHPSEAVKVLQRVREIPNKRIFYCIFVDPNNTKAYYTRQCFSSANPSLPSHQQCDLSKPEVNGTWICKKPEKLPCSTVSKCWWDSGRSRTNVLGLVTNENKNIFKKPYLEEELEVNPKEPIHVLEAEPSTSQHIPACTWDKSAALGHWSGKVWTSSVCNVRVFTKKAIQWCLANKTVFMQEN